MPRNDFLVGWGNVYRIQWVIAYEAFGYHTEFLIVNFLCGFGSGNGTDAKYYVVITCAGRRRWCMTYFESLSCAQIKCIINRSLISLVFSLASSYSKPSIYRFLYNLVVGPPTYSARNAAELGKMGNHYRCLVTTANRAVVRRNVSEAQFRYSVRAHL